MATHSSALAWRMPCTEEQGRPQSMELQSPTQLHDFHFHFEASLTAQLVKNLPAMWETPVPFLGREAPLEKG